MAQESKRIILERTARGSFARTGSSGSRARRYNPKYAARHGKGANGPVTLSLSGQMLNSMVGQSQITDEFIFSFIEFDNVDAEIKAAYHQDLGAGPPRIFRRFVFLNQEDKRNVIREGARAAGWSHHSHNQPRDRRGRFVSYGSNP